MNNFAKLGLSENILEVLNQLGFTNPTPIQEQAIPILLSKDPTDFIGLAQTGTGKTAAFGLPLIDLIDENDKSTQAIIMAPTRELGQQTAKQVKDFCQNNKSVNVEVVYGGANITTQIKALKRPTQIVVATPGRLIDLIKRKAVNLNQVNYVILDEADEMLNMGFKEDIDKILSYTPDHRKTWLFSATMPAEIRKIVNKYMHQPAEVSIDTKQKTNADIEHQFVITKTANKLPALRRFLDIQPDMRGIMFCRTKRETQEIADTLSQLGYAVEALHGDMSQGQRDTVMRKFKNRSMQLLIATDVAARGIDVNDLTYVIHHTLPDQLESYTHRSGRTGRAGNKGISLVFINPREGRKIKDLEKKLKVQFKQVEVPSANKLKSTRIHHWVNLIINTKIDPQAEEIIPEVFAKFATMSKEDLLKRLISTQLDHIISDNQEDLNELQGAPSDGGGKSDRGRKSDGGGSGNRYFINIGTMDGVTKADLVHFLSDISSVDRQAFDNITMQKSHSFFDVVDGSGKKVAKAFEDIEVEGRNIRVNQDNERSNKEGKGGKKKDRDRKGRRNTGNRSRKSRRR